MATFSQTEHELGTRRRLTARRLLGVITQSRGFSCFPYSSFWLG